MEKLLNKTEKEDYDSLFIKLAWLKYYGEGTTEELKNIPKLENLLKSTPKPEIIPISEDSRIEFGNVKLGEFISAEELPKLYKRMGYFADNSTGKFEGNYKLMYISVFDKITKYSLADDYDDLEHFDRVNEYANILRSGEELPPIIYTNGLFKDGAHRMAAHYDVGRRKILAFYSEK